jgi:hypothetical protein
MGHWAESDTGTSATSATIGMTDHLSFTRTSM